jgi:dihydroorotate dehydrogenase
MMTVLSTTLASIPCPSCFKDAQEALRRGAKAVQIGSALMKEGPAVFACIQQELSAA